MPINTQKIVTQMSFSRGNNDAKTEGIARGPNCSLDWTDFMLPIK